MSENPETVVPLDDIRADVKRWRAAVHRIRYWKAVANQAATPILAHMRAADATTGTVSGRDVVTLTRHERQQLDSNRLREDHPDIADAYTTPRPEWRLHLPSDMDGAA